MDSEQLTTLIRARRKELHLSQKEFAYKLSRKPSTYNYIERNLHKAHLSTLNEIFEGLNLHFTVIRKEEL